MNVKPKLMLGTAQFGMNYGTFNTTGKVKLDEARAILRQARLSQIDFLDTARNYGQSEETLGKIPEASKFNLVTKCPPLSAASDPIQALEDHFEKSLRALNTNRIYGYLLHRTSDLTSSCGCEIWECLTRLRDSGKIERIGVSAYEADEVVALLNVYPMTLIQLPANTLSPWIYEEKYRSLFMERDIEVHTRSTFLQGFLLAEPDHLPIHLTKWKNVLNEFRAQANTLGMKPLQAALVSIISQPMIDKVVVGVDNLLQLQQIIDASVHNERFDPFTFKNLASSERGLIDPRCWK